MPSFPCSHPTCGEYVPNKGGSCPEHGNNPGGSRHTVYDQHFRDRVAKAFYDSAAWKRVRAAVLAAFPVCQRCQKSWACHVHHIVPLALCTEYQKLARENLMGVCVPCHNILEHEAKRR